MFNLRSGSFVRVELCLHKFAKVFLNKRVKRSRIGAPVRNLFPPVGVPHGYSPISNLHAGRKRQLKLL